MKPQHLVSRAVLGARGLVTSAEVTDVRVDDSGVSARSSQEAICDVLFDDRRIFSFWLHRDGVRQGRRWLVAWPGTLGEFLDGTATVSVVVHATGQEVFRDRVTLGSGEGTISVARPHTGQPLSLDKSWRRVVTFDTRTAQNREPLMDAIEVVLDELSQVGLEAFLAYGTLLGAVREGKLIGHDSDADLGYVSRFTHPVDAIGESFRVQSELQARGHRVHRYSALAFKVDVEEGDGVVRGLDVFGGFLMDGHLHLMGEIRVPFEESWIFPLSTAVLEGRTLATPADPDRLLAATYGASWRVPDPAFHFETPPSTHRRLNGWFRGQQVGFAPWARAYSQIARRVPEPSAFVRWIAEREPELVSFVDVGCGQGADVLAMARSGVESLGLDFQGRAFAKAQGKAVEHASFATMNLLELRHVLAVGAATARFPGPRVVAARHLVDNLGADARRQLWRLARMSLSGPDGGRLYLEFLVRAGEDGYARSNRVEGRRPAEIVAELEGEGAVVVHRERRPVSALSGASVLCRLVVEWPSRTRDRNED